MECMLCEEKIHQGDKYYKTCSSIIENMIEEDKCENVFCSKKCFCEYLELIDDVNDEVELYESEDDDEYDSYREKEKLEGI